jgi:hypothetical protein
MWPLCFVVPELFAIKSGTVRTCRGFFRSASLSLSFLVDTWSGITCNDLSTCATDQSLGECMLKQMHAGRLSGAVDADSGTKSCPRHKDK